MRPIVAVLFVALLVPVGCSLSHSWSESSVTVTREIELPPGTTFSVGGGEGDSVESSVTVPEGHPHAGTYTTTSPHLHTPLRDAMNMMGRPGAKSSIVVDEEGEIQSVSNEVTMQ